MNDEFKNVLDLSERVRERIIKDCRISRVTFWNWVNEKTPIPLVGKREN